MAERVDRFNLPMMGGRVHAVIDVSSEVTADELTVCIEAIGIALGTYREGVRYADALARTDRGLAELKRTTNRVIERATHEPGMENEVPDGGDPNG